MRYFFLSILVLLTVTAFAQEGSITGNVYDEINNDPIPFANVVIQGTTEGTTTDLDGNFELTGLAPGLYTIEVSFLGYQTKTLFELSVSAARPVNVSIGLAESDIAVDEIEITASPFERKVETPLSLRSIGASEIERFPGANRDISRVVQSFPGVTTTLSFRNDLIIRGGSPNENRFYLDGIEVPNINHFSTQGASGGSNGLINVDFIENVDFYAAAFPSNLGNTLSSVFDFKFKDGRTDRPSMRFTLSATEAGISAEGPLSKKKNTTFIASVRRSYQQLLFRAFGLPFLPTYNDAQFKIKSRISDDHELTILGLGAIDDFELNLDANETDDQRYLLGRLPYQTQKSYTIGAKYKYFRDNSYFTFVLSRSQLRDEYIKYRDNDNVNPDALIYAQTTDQSENKFRFEHTVRFDGFKFNYGINYEFAQYTNSTENTIPTANDIIFVNYTSDLNLHKWGTFMQLSRGFMEENLLISFGLRADATNFSSITDDLLDQISPRFSVSYAVLPKMDINFNVGRYYQLPPYTTLGFRDNAGTLVNATTDGVKYIGSTHIVLGTSYTTSTNTKFSIEGFYKMYDDYPFLLTDSIPLANVGGFFGVFGDQPATATSEGRSYGLEFMVQQKYYNGFYGILSYTIFRSEFLDKDGIYRNSSWDVGHALNITGGRSFKKNWDIGFRFNVAGGSPYTPFDVERSSLIAVWDLNGEGVLDYDQLNEERTRIAHQLDVRVDKRWFFSKWNLNLYLDIRNLYGAKPNQQDYLDVVRDDQGVIQIDPNDPSRYQTRFVIDDQGIVLPSLGIVIEL